MDTENRKDWYDKADCWEIDFVTKYGDKFGVIINPSKETYKTSPDLYLLKSSQSADLKMLNTPFYKSESVYGIPTQHCWTFNPSDLFEYSVKHDNNFGIFIWKIFKDSNDYGVTVDSEEGVYYISLFDLKRIISNSNKIHHYIRRMNDTNGNSFGSHGVDLRKFHKIA